MREKEANENNLSVQRRKIFEQLEEMEKQLLTRKVEMAKTPEKENILFKTKERRSRLRKHLPLRELARRQ